MGGSGHAKISKFSLGQAAWPGGLAWQAGSSDLDGKKSSFFILSVFLKYKDFFYLYFT
jgi:hypothetical protein